MTRDVLLFMQQTPATNGNMFGNFRQRGTVFYRVRYSAVRCIHLVIPFPGQMPKNYPGF